MLGLVSITILDTDVISRLGTPITWVVSVEGCGTIRLGSKLELLFLLILTSPFLFEVNILEPGIALLSHTS